MPDNRPIFALLLRETNPATDDALVAALPRADVPTAHAIVQTILARNQPTGLHGLIACFHELDQSLRQLVLHAAEQVFRVLREATHSQDDRVRLNVIDFIRHAGLYRSSYLLETALHDRSTHVRQAAAETIHALADRLLTPLIADPSHPHEDAMDIALTPDQLHERMEHLDARREDRQQLVAAIAASLVSFNMHLQPRVVEAAMWMVDDLGMRFWSMLSAPNSKVLRAAINIFDGTYHPRMVPFTVSALNHAEFRSHALKALALCNDAAFLVEFFRQGWRLREPKTARNLGMLKNLACLERRVAGMLQLPPDAQRHVPSLIHAVGIATESKIDLIRELQRRAEPQARKAALWSLIATSGERITAVLRTIAGERDAVAARAAQYELARRLPQQFRPDDLLKSHIAPNMPGENTKEAAFAPTAPMDFDQYWSDFDHFSEQDRLDYGRQIRTKTPDFESRLENQLKQSESSAKIRAIRMICALGIIDAFAEQFYKLCHDTDSSVRSAAVLAVGRLSTPTSRLILHKALLDPDHRVQANAIEAAECLDEKLDTNALLPKLVSPDNRVRANAVKALLKLGVRQAAETLLLMLQDQNRAQRISALWLIDHMGLFTLATRVLNIAEADQDVQVRDRAQKLTGRITDTKPHPVGADA